MWTLHFHSPQQGGKTPLAILNQYVGSIIKQHFNTILSCVAYSSQEWSESIKSTLFNVSPSVKQQCEDKNRSKRGHGLREREKVAAI